MERRVRTENALYLGLKVEVVCEVENYSLIRFPSPYSLEGNPNPSSRGLVPV